MKKTSKETRVLLQELLGGKDLPSNGPDGFDLYGADLHGADLCGAHLCGADLYGADLRGADLRGADLRRADLYGADLRETDLRGADLRGANLCQAYLRGANLREAYLRGANLENTEIFSFTAGGHFGFYVPWADYLKIGCVDGSLQWWSEKYQTTGEAYGYSLKSIRTYAAVIRFIVENIKE